MSKNKNIEDLLKDKLNNQEFEIQENWLENMSGQIDEMNEVPKRKKGAIYILLALLLLVASIGGLLLITKPNNNNITKDEVIVDEVKNNEIDFKESKQTQTINNKQEIFTENEYSSNEDNIKRKSEEIDNSNIDKTEMSSKRESKSKKENENLRKSFKTLTKSIINKENIKEETSNSKTLFSDNKNSKSSSQDNNTTQENNSINKPHFSILNQLESNSNNTKIGLSKKINFEENEKVNQIEENKQNSNTSSEINSNENELNSSENNLIIPNINNSNIENENIKTIKIDTVPNNENILSKDSSVVVKNNIKKVKGFNVILKAGPSYLTRNFDSKNTKRNNEESNLLTWNAGLEVNKTFGRFIIGSGLHLTNYGENIDYKAVEYNLQDSSYVDEEKTIYHRTVSNESGNLVISTDSISHITESVLIIRDSTYLDESLEAENGNTNFKYVEIPIQFGYKIVDTKKVEIDIMTGISAGFLLNEKGSYLNTENKFEKANSNKILFNYLLSADIKYSIYKNVNLVVSPNFKTNLNNLSTIKATRKKYSSFGVNAGISLEF